MSRRLTQQTQGRGGGLQLPAYEPPILPLHGSALETLTTHVPKSHESIEKHIKAAMQELTTATSELGGRLHDGPVSPELRRLLDALHDAAKSTVDVSTRLLDSKSVLIAIGTAESRRTITTEEARRLRARARRAPDEDSGDEAEAAEAEREADQENAEPVAVKEGVWGRYREAYENKMEVYEAKTPGEKYADVQEYADFRRTLWDVQNPDIPMPPARNWFLDGAAATVEESDDDEIEVAQERISYNCPITLCQFVSPVKSKVCGHSYEKEAVLELLRRDVGTPKNCPMSGCSQRLTTNDLEDNAWLLGKMKRHLKRQERDRRRDEMEESGEEEEEKEEEMEEQKEEDEDVTPSRMGLKIKKEKRRPASRRGRKKVMELLDDDDDGEGEE